VNDYCFSPSCPFISGVSQGSVLGPLLFVVYINGIDSHRCSCTTIQLFADDAKLHNEIDIRFGSLTLQQILDRLANWASEWRLTNNISKYAVLSLSNKSQPTLPA
jgi:ribonuclease P/MRP protein subunit RPP40